MSSPATFHQFPLLPYELRRYIYILATPPRIVHVRESYPVDNKGEIKEEWLKLPDNEDYPYEGYKRSHAYERFRDQYRAKPLPSLHPDLAYFARNWARGDLFSAGAQTRLEQFGFTAPRRKLPWPATGSVPQIEPIWLERHLDAAFELLRESYLYSQAPIPALLHTCRDSRITLTHFGYQLAFGTRTHKARTWFHFGRDSLYIPQREEHRFLVRQVCRGWAYRHKEPWPYRKLLSGPQWDIGQFDPRDLRRVRRVILAVGPNYLELGVDSLAGFFPLLPGLEELYFELWTPDEIRTWFENEDKLDQFYGMLRSTGKSNWFRNKVQFNRFKADGHDQRNRGPEKSGARGGGPREPWRWLPAEEIDRMVTLFCPNRLVCFDEYARRLPNYSGLYRDEEYIYLTAHKEDGPADMQLFDSKAQAFEEVLASELACPTTRGGEATSQVVPKCKFVHVCADSLARRLSEGRLSFWHYYVKLREAYAKDRSFIPLTVDAPTPPPPFRPRWEDTGASMWNHFLQGQKMSARDLRARMETLSDTGLYYSLRGWFLTKACVLEPTSDVI